MVAGRTRAGRGHAPSGPMRFAVATDASVLEASDLIKSGRLIGMPTETVYGIAANAFDEQAIAATFEAKGRPSENPLIVHIDKLARLEEVARDIPSEAEVLAKKFWPGPLTIVLSKRGAIPDIATAGLDTVAVRMPAHPVALKLIELSNVPLTAPSANLFTGLSPTRAEAIEPEIARILAMILDGGPCQVGIESTVLDLTGPVPLVLRPGAVTVDEIAAEIGQSVAHASSADTKKSPGQYQRHYSPKTPITIIAELTSQPGLTMHKPQYSSQRQMSDDPKEYARQLYSALAQLDKMGLEEIFVEAPPTSPEWDAIWDRLRKACG